MPILIDGSNKQFESSDPQQIYNALQSGNYKLLPNSDLHIKDTDNNTWQLNSAGGDINQQLIHAFDNGARFESKDEAFNRMYPELTGVSGDVLAGVSSAANSALFGLPSLALSGTKGGELFSSLRNTHPISSMIGDVAGVVTNFTPAGAVANVAGKAVGFQAASMGGKLAGMAAEGATIGGLSSIPLAVTETSLGEPGYAAEHFIGNVGGGALIGAIASPLLGVALPKAAELFGKGTSKATQVTNEGLGVVTQKIAPDMTAEQQQLFNNLVKDPEARQAALSLTKDVEEVTIKSTVQDLQNLSTLIETDVKNLYNTKFDNIVNGLQKESVLSAKQEMLTLIKEARETIKANPESYDSSFFKSLTAAEKTLDIRGAVNIKSRETMEEALRKLTPDKYDEINKGFDIVSAKAIKLARTEIGYKAGFDAAKIGIDRTGALSKDLYAQMSEVTKKLYGNDFVKISDTYSQTKEVLDTIKKLAFNTDGTVNYSKVKSMISDNKASELKLDDLLDKVQSLSKTSGNEYNFGSKLDDTLKSIRTKQILKSIGGDKIVTESTLIKGGLGTSIASTLGVPTIPVMATYGLYKSLKNPRSSLALMNFLQQSQVKTANAVNKIATTVSKGAFKLPAAYNVMGESRKSTEKEIIKDIQTYQMFTSPVSIQDGFKESFGILGKVAPNVSASIQAKSMDIAQFLSSKAPAVSTDPISGETRVISSQQKVNEYIKYKSAVNDPIQALKEINAGVNVSMNREVIQALYPNMWASYVQTKLQSLQGKNLTTQEKRQINSTLQLSNEDFTLPTVINSVLMTTGGTNGAPQQPSSVQSPSSSTGSTDRLQRVNQK